jgi:hypothetical protein
MLIEFFPSILALVLSLLGDYDANQAKMILATMIIFN